jgi:NAD(P)-dependent dehydrogenase (short-subunit alcohol dehydrogenase family)
VTGAGRGIGRAIAERFAAEGARIAAVDVDGEAAAETAAALGGGSFGHAADVGSSEDAAGVAKEVRERFGRLDVLVNNAGIIHLEPLLELADEDWERVLRVNLSGPFYMSRAVAPLMVETGGGSIVNISSVSAEIGSVERGPYSASKAGLLGLTRVLATELGQRGVRVNAILPGPVETKLSDDAYTTEIEAAFVGRTALNRRGRPGELAAAVLFLAGDESSYMTGQSLVVDGGYLTTGLRD